jgi:hypothetical protein
MFDRVQIFSPELFALTFAYIQNLGPELTNEYIT